MASSTQEAPSRQPPVSRPAPGPSPHPTKSPQKPRWARPGAAASCVEKPGLAQICWGYIRLQGLKLNMHMIEHASQRRASLATSHPPSPLGGSRDCVHSAGQNQLDTSWGDATKVYIMHSIMGTYFFHVCSNYTKSP